MPPVIHRDNRMQVNLTDDQLRVFKQLQELYEKKQKRRLSASKVLAQAVDDAYIHSIRCTV